MITVGQIKTRSRYRQTAKNKKNSLLMKKNSKKFWLYEKRLYLCSVVKALTITTQTKQKQIKKLNNNNLKLQNYENKKGLFR